MPVADVITPPRAIQPTERRPSLPSRVVRFCRAGYDFAWKVFLECVLRLVLSGFLAEHGKHRRSAQEVLRPPARRVLAHWWRERWLEQFGTPIPIHIPFDPERDQAILAGLVVGGQRIEWDQPLPQGFESLSGHPRTTEFLGITWNYDLMSAGSGSYPPFHFRPWVRALYLTRGVAGETYAAFDGVLAAVERALARGGRVLTDDREMPQAYPNAAVEWEAPAWRAMLRLGSDRSDTPLVRFEFVRRRKPPAEYERLLAAGLIAEPNECHHPEDRHPFVEEE